MGTQAELTREEWLTQRRTGIGGSDVAAICSQDEFGGTPLSVYEEKLDLVPEKPVTPAMAAGQELEPLVARKFQLGTGRAVRKQKMRRDADHPWMIANVDRQIIATGGKTIILKIQNEERPAEGPGVLEIKCPGIRNYAKQKAYGLSKGYVLQLQHYLHVFKYTWGSFAMFGREAWKPIFFDVERDDELCAFLVDVEGKFWKCVEDHDPPEAVEIELPDIPEVKGEVIVREDPEFVKAVEIFEQADELKRTGIELDKTARQALKELMGVGSIAEAIGWRFHYQQRTGRKTFQQDVLRKHGALDAIKVMEWITKNVVGDMGIDTLNKLRVDLALDIDQFVKVGDSFKHFQPFALKAHTEEE